jgi:excisionase family DNA binding protein
VQRPLSVPEAAERLGVSPRFIRRLVAERRIPYLKLGRHVRFDPADLDAFLIAGRVEPEDLAPWRAPHSQR